MRLFRGLLLVHTMTPKLAKELMHRMVYIRRVEEEIARRYPEGKMRCPTHLSVGQEAVAAGVGMALRVDDLAVSGHRAHAHYIAKGGDVPAMIAEIYGKVGGCCRGKGGSMHLIDETVGFMGSTAIVGGTVPVGVGLAYGIHCKGTDQISCIFHGDAVVETGVFFESINFAAIKKLPVLFVCENNLYSVYSPLSVRQPDGRSIAGMVQGLGVPASAGDGNDILEVYGMTCRAVENIRQGGGPQFLEFSTYRWLEHCGPNYDNDLGYRTEAEFFAWKAREPLGRFVELARSNGWFDQSDVDQMEVMVYRAVEEAFEFAETSPFPDPFEAFADLYVGDRAVAMQSYGLDK
jgi:TPP-dependent pyruvate/acetoin dehydrogenase alpha subunit